jgi:hypothetical protein
MTHVITHRGLDPSKQNYFKESTIEAFTDQLKRGYGLEFDLRVTKDKKIVIIHDGALTRMTHGVDTRNVSDVDASEILSMDFEGSHVTTFDVLLNLIEELQAPGVVSAIHLKIGSQVEDALDLILTYLENVDKSLFYIFDTTLKTAKYLKAKSPAVRIAPSVAHLYDRMRYNGVVGDTLLSLDEVLNNRDLFSGVWLDEWDLQDDGGGTKKLYTQEVFGICKKAGLWVGLVTPELHGTSPGLLGGEAHADAKSFDTLKVRLQEIVRLAPDAICTDYPDYVHGLISER